MPKMKRYSKAISQYLQHYAEPMALTICSDLETISTGPKATGWTGTQNALVIPCYDESPDFAHRLESHPAWQRGITAIVVINQPNHLQPRTAKNQKLLAYFAELPGSQAHSWGSLAVRGQSLWIVIDACGDLAPSAQHGVGLMRKLGADLATGLWHQGLIQSTWLHSTDADASLPEDYFELPEQNDYSAALYEFAHLPAQDPATTEATQTYEAAIRYYAKSLSWAGSPYGFVALGSTLAVRFTAYCQVRGFPKKSGGEDFYLINKAIKLGDCYFSKSLVTLESRLSHRVPFGTGPATEAIIELQQQDQAYPYYAPACFRALKTWIEFVETGGDYAHLSLTPAPIQAAANALDVARFIAHTQKQRHSDEQKHAAFHQWFDGFKTLKFIRYLRTHYYPDRDLAECLANAVYL